MNETRFTNRRCYWEEKYQDPQWDEDIHLALFPPGRNDGEGFRQGIKLNTQKLLGDISELSHFNEKMESCTVLDFGCGAGDFLVQMGIIGPQVRCIGIDIAQNAIVRATRRAIAAGVDDRIEWKIGGVSALSEISQDLDIVVCRDMYYLLDKEEQEEFFANCQRLLPFGGVLYIADLSIKGDVLSKINSCLLDRQFGSDPITWEVIGHSGARRYSIEKQSGRHGFCSAKPPQIDEFAVANSYSAAAALTSDPGLKNAYEEIASVAKMKDHGLSLLPYARFYFSRSQSKVD